ncbi:MAG: hypothetical protein R3B89_27480 [Polyangiaceae bacterium]
MKHFVSFICLSAALAIVGCGDDNSLIEEANNTVDCGQICSTYSDCVTDIDVTDCTDYCEDEADKSEQTEDRVQACEDCLDDKSCSEAAMSCWDNCAFVPVPE